ncbi:MAG: ribonuclease domain-containing protein [Anaerococcus prevotii]|nr:ribonuclease domain-containing protein [Anaerococcus prevotii]
MKVKKYSSYLLVLLALIFTSCRLTGDKDIKISDEIIEENIGEEGKGLDKDGSYYSLEDVSSYLVEFNHLPPNYITKKEAMDLGWSPKDGNLWDVTDKAVIGGDYFGNFEGNLPEGNYKEADVNYKGGRRGAERIVFDEDTNIYYTKDHYETFERINP